MTGVFLPAMRQLVAGKLRSRGLSQNRVSSILGVTQASVSMYLSSGPEKAYRLLSRFAVTRRAADSDAEVLADQLLRDPAESVRGLNSIWTALLGSGAACTAHREAYPSLAGCDFCLKEYGSRGSSLSEAVAQVTQAVRLLEESSQFVAVMPEVSVNIACAAADAASPADVVAIPGRIVKVRQRAKAMLPPEPGASAHMAGVLLTAKRRRGELRACINLRYDPKMASVLRVSGLRTLNLGTRRTGGTLASTAELLEKKIASSASFDAVVDEGGSGIEPNVYLFAKGAPEVAKLALKLAKAYSAA